MNCKSLKAAIIYASSTGNTLDLAGILQSCFRDFGVEPDLYNAREFRAEGLAVLDFAVVATYTWGSGEIPKEMKQVYEAFEQHEVKHLITGAAGTGDRFYPYFCGAVDEFRDMLFVHTNLAATLKIELTPQDKDYERCRQFVQAMLARMGNLTY
ncbi:flavodoxin domain-containing protein [Mesobacillus foraminis]|uniref:flavodoxin domain-containing protein n=1 Tax=Mesobacillus foraminis TaxID=279826 RepID=UPI0039A23D45